MAARPEGKSRQRITTLSAEDREIRKQVNKNDFHNKVRTINRVISKLHERSIFYGQNPNQAVITEKVITDRIVDGKPVVEFVQFPNSKEALRALRDAIENEMSELVKDFSAASDRTRRRVEKSQEDIDRNRLTNGLRGIIRISPAFAGFLLTFLNQMVSQGHPLVRTVVTMEDKSGKSTRIYTAQGVGVTFTPADLRGLNGQLEGRAGQHITTGGTVQSILQLYFTLFHLHRPATDNRAIARANGVTDEVYNAFIAGQLPAQQSQAIDVALKRNIVALDGALRKLMVEQNPQGIRNPDIINIVAHRASAEKKLESSRRNPERKTTREQNVVYTPDNFPTRNERMIMNLFQLELTSDMPKYVPVQTPQGLDLAPRSSANIADPKEKKFAEKVSNDQEKKVKDEILANPNNVNALISELDLTSGLSSVITQNMYGKGNAAFVTAKKAYTSNARKSARSTSGRASGRATTEQASYYRHIVVPRPNADPNPILFPLCQGCGPAPSAAAPSGGAAALIQPPGVNIGGGAGAGGVGMAGAGYMAGAAPAAAVRTPSPAAAPPSESKMGGQSGAAVYTSPVRSSNGGGMAGGLIAPNFPPLTPIQQGQGNVLGTPGQGQGLVSGAL